MNLQSVFSQSDQCLRILDPIDLWLDRLQQGAVQPSDLARTRYFLARLPDAPPDEADSGRPLARSLGAYYAKKQGQTPAYQDRVRLAYRQRSEFIKRTDVAWHADVARWAGVEPTLIGILDDAIGAAEVFADWTVPEWLDWWLLWLSTHIEVSSVLHRADERRDELAHLVGDTDAHQRLLRLTSAWMRGETLEMLQTQLGTSSKKGLPCEGARKFVLRMLPDVSFGARLLGRVYRSKFVDRSHLPASLEALPGCIAHGFALPEELALHYLSGAKSRLQVKVAYIELRPHLLAVADRAVSFADVRDRVKGALRRFGRDPV